jgi:acetoin utilization deacetylase AcuC-like enzyme
MIPTVHHPAYEFDIGPHVFPTRKYRLILDRLVRENTISIDDVRAPRPVTDDDVRLVHTGEYVRKINQDALTPAERMTLEIPFSRELRDAMWLCTGGTLLTATLAKEHAVCVHIGGGFHHAFPDHGEGFCLINDVAIAAAMLKRGGVAERILVIDLDVHHGNGTAAIFADDPDVFTFSMHQERNYPGWKPRGDCDVGLEDGTTDGEYHSLLERTLTSILSRHGTQLAFYLAGADPYAQDQLGGLGLTIQGLRRRDEIVFELLRAAGIPVAVTLAGGYAWNTDDTIEIHCNTVRVAKTVHAP